jgi:hypothetical protein
MNLFNRNDEYSNAPQFPEILEDIAFPDPFNGSIVINNDNYTVVYEIENSKLKSVAYKETNLVKTTT